MLGTHHKHPKPCVLVVDDDPIFDGLVVDHLTEDNEYDVLSARGGEQALKILKQTNIDVLITDIKMPSPDGFELITQVRRDCPLMSVIVISGFGRPRWLSQGDTKNGLQFMEKPINFLKLKKLLRKAVFDALPAPDNPSTVEEKMDQMMLEGHAAQFPVLDMIQICCIAERTGRVTLQRGGLDGHIYLDQGEIVHAQCHALSGACAFKELTTWEDGDFSFENTVCASNRTIFQSWESLVYDSIQQRAQRAAA
jgi:CheY-like chemotaxis protein